MFSKQKKNIIVSNLRFIRNKIFMLSCVEHEKRFITPGPGSFHLTKPRQAKKGVFPT